MTDSVALAVNALRKLGNAHSAFEFEVRRRVDDPEPLLIGAA